MRSPTGIGSPPYLIALLGLILTPVVITPWWNYESTHLPKFIFFSCLAGGGFGYLIRNLNFKNKSESKSEKWLLFFCSAAIFSMFTSFFSSDSPKAQQLFGLFGRNNGLLSNFSLIIVLLVTSRVQNFVTTKKFVLALLIPICINSIYSNYQLFAEDLFNNQSLYQGSYGTLGNPNFLSTHLGMGLVILFSLFFHSKTHMHKSIYFALFLLNFVGLRSADSLQGYIVAVIGVFILFLIEMRKKIALMSRKIVIISFAILTLFTIEVLRGFLGQGVLGDYIFQETLQVRLNFWKVAWRIFIDNPWHGVGLDSFGDWYLQFQRDTSGLSGIRSNSAHNIYLDWLAFGGAPLFLSFILIILIISARSLQVIHKKSALSGNETLLITLWFCYLAQGFISINNLGIASWGFIFGGLIMTIPIDKKIETSINPRIEKKAYFMSLFSALIFFTFAFPAYYQDAKFRSAVDTRNGAALIKAASLWPHNQMFLNLTVDVLLSNGLYNQALRLVDKPNNLNPRNDYVLRRLYDLDKLEEPLKGKIANKLIKIDPSFSP